ncbi:MAG: YitT family protein [Bacteroidaceae bacterium]|nr:YitT family protein [Bacteroidaceae bacterium]
MDKLFTKRDINDFAIITLGLLIYAFAWAIFLLPYQITTGGTAGIGAIIYYAVGFPMQYTYLIINAFLIFLALKVLGLRFTIRTGYAILMLSLFLEVSQEFVQNYVQADVYKTLVDGARVPLILGEGQEFMATLLGSSMCGFALGVVFNANGSTGGTDIVAACVNKYRDISLGNVILIFDLCIISSCYFVFHSWQRVIFGIVALSVTSFVIDYVVNRRQSSVQFFIMSKEYAKIADRINMEMHRGVTVLQGTGWYTKNGVEILMVVASRRQSREIFHLIKEIDPKAFITQSSVIGAYGEGFKTIKN